MIYIYIEGGYPARTDQRSGRRMLLDNGNPSEQKARCNQYSRGNTAALFIQFDPDIDRTWLVNTVCWDVLNIYKKLWKALLRSFIPFNFDASSEARAKPRASERKPLLPARLPHQNKPDMTMTHDREKRRRKKHDIKPETYHDDRHSRIKALKTDLWSVEFYWRSRLSHNTVPKSVVFVDKQLIMFLLSSARTSCINKPWHHHDLRTHVWMTYYACGSHSHRQDVDRLEEKQRFAPKGVQWSCQR